MKERILDISDKEVVIIKVDGVTVMHIKGVIDGDFHGLTTAVVVYNGD